SRYRARKTTRQQILSVSSFLSTSLPALLHAAVTQAVRLHASSYSCRTLGALAVSPPAPAIAVNRARLSSSDVTTNPATPPSPAPLAATHRAGRLTRQSVAGSPPGK